MARINKSSLNPGDTFYGSDHIYIDPFNPGSSLTPGTGGDSWISNQPDVSAPVGPEIADTDSEMARMVKNSAPYKQAYSLFSKETDKTWLMLLEAIPYSVTDAEEFWTDGWLTSGYSDKVSANYQYCMEQITKLIKDYMTYRNSLPTTQANQLAQIGYNSAITGDGLNGSEMSFTDPSANPSSVLHSKPLDAFNLISSFVLSGVNGFVDLATKFANLRLTKQRTDFDMNLSEASFIKDINKYARDNGISFNKTLKSFSDFDDLHITDPDKVAIETRKFFESALSTDHYRPLLTAMKYDNGSISDFLKGYVNGAPYFGNIHGSEPTAVNDFVLYQYEMYKLQKQWDIENKQYNHDILKYAVGSEQYKSSSAKHQSKIDEFNKQKAELLDSMIDRLHSQAESGDMDATLLLSKILSSYNYSDIDVLKNNARITESDANFRDAQNTMGLTSDLIDNALK